jgi:hypothetical protein
MHKEITTLAFWPDPVFAEQNSVTVVNSQREGIGATPGEDLPQVYCSG